MTPSQAPRDVPTAKQRILQLLKSSGGSTAAQLATVLGITDTAVRQHLVELELRGLVESECSEQDGQRRGRPAARWRTTDLAAALFPDRHADLAVSILQALESSLGEEAVQRMLQARGDRQSLSYEQAMPENASLLDRLEALSHRRTEEGYMAEVRSEPDGSFLFIEHHCPICAAATVCQGLCREELRVFRSILGPAKVEREAHLLSGDARCVYRIDPASVESEDAPSPFESDPDPETRRR